VLPLNGLFRFGASGHRRSEPVQRVALRAPLKRGGALALHRGGVRGGAAAGVGAADAGGSARACADARRAAVGRVCH